MDSMNYVDSNRENLTNSFKRKAGWDGICFLKQNPLTFMVTLVFYIDK